MLRRAVALGFFSAALVTFVLISSANPVPNKPIWAKKGVTFSAPCGSRPFDECRPLRIPSPDGKSAVDVSYDTTPDYPDIEVARLRVATLGKYVGEVQPVGSVESELTWSLDSRAFFINGNDNANGDDHLAVHLLNDPTLGPGYITNDVVQDMARSFPPVKLRIRLIPAPSWPPIQIVMSGSRRWIGSMGPLRSLSWLRCRAARQWVASCVRFSGMRSRFQAARSCVGWKRRSSPGAGNTAWLGNSRTLARLSSKAKCRKFVNPKATGYPPFAASAPRS
jgi:hypothetical protein